MSETRTAPPVAGRPGIPLKPGEQVITDSSGRTLVISELTPSAMLNVMEMAGGSGSNDGWIRFAMLFCSVTAIDGLPKLFPHNKAALLKRADEVGNEGMVAISEALSPASSRPEDEDEAVADLKAQAEAELAAARSS